MSGGAAAQAPFSLTVSGDIGQVAPGEWDRLAAGDPMSGHGWLRTVQESCTRKMVPRYVLLRQAGRLLGASVLYLQAEDTGPLTLDHIFFGRLRQAARFCGASFLPAAECYPFRQYGRHFFIEKRLPAAERSAVLQQLFTRVEEEAFQRGQALCFMHVMEHEKELIRLLRTAGYCQTMDYPMNYLDIAWADFEGYKKAIARQSRKRKQNITREINRNQRQGVRIRPLAQIGPHAERLHELLDLNCRKHNQVPFPFQRDFLARLKDALGENCVIYIAEKSGLISGVSLLLKNGPVAYLPMVGIDHELAANDATYFNLTFYRPIQDAIQARIRRLHYGNAQYFLKRKRGCQTSGCYLFYRSPRRVRNGAARAWFPLHRRWLARKHAHFSLAEYLPVAEDA